MSLWLSLNIALNTVAISFINCYRINDNSACQKTRVVMMKNNCMGNSFCVPLPNTTEHIKQHNQIIMLIYNLKKKMYARALIQK